MKNIKLILASILLLTNCASYHQLMVGPDGSIQDCSGTGQGLIGMAVASSHVNGCRDNLLKAGYLEIERAGVIGVTFRTDSTYVLKVAPNSPAQKAGIVPGDFISKISGQRITSSKDASILLFGEANTKVDITLVGNGKTEELTLLRASYTSIYGTPKK